MRERIILAPGLNGTELTRSLALHGVNCIGLRICNAAELARLALMRSGISIAEDFISAREEIAIVAEAVAGESYFGKASYSDIQEIAEVLRRMRCLVASGNEGDELERILSQGIFQEKNSALLNVYRRYMNLLAQSHAIDSVSLICKAIAEAKTLAVEFVTLKEYPLNPIEKALLDKVSGASDKVSNAPDKASGSVKTETNLYELLGVKEGKLHIDSIKNCYGAPNEVESILSDIYAGKQLDECTIAVTDAATYSQLFYDYALLYDIPITFGCGIPIANSNPARLTALYYKWITNGFFGTKAVNEMLSSDAFDRGKLFEQLSKNDEEFSRSTFIEMLGSLRLTNNREINKRRLENFKQVIGEEAALRSKEDTKDYRRFQKKLQCIPALEIAAEELALPAEEFISKYSYIRKGSGSNAEQLTMILDQAAAGTIYEELKVIRNSGVEQSVDEILPNILRLRVCTQRSEAGKLHVTGVNGAFASMRKNLYIAGLSASNYPGSPRENYLLLDSDLNLFGPDAVCMTADGKVLRKRDQLLTLAHLASALGTEISVSYAGLNVSELKKDNPSSLIFELFREEHGQNTTAGELEENTRKVDYFEPAISVSRLVGRAYTQGQKIIPGEPSEREENPFPWSLEKAWSPTELDTFFGCPRRFMLAYLLGIPEPEDYDPFEIMTALDTGILAHSLMEVLGGTSMSKEAFMKLSEEYFDRFLAGHPPLITENVYLVKGQFLDMMETAYEKDPHGEVVLEEKDISCLHESGVRIHGFPDRVEKLDDGSYLVVDFKSGRRITHVQDDIGTCLQVIIYAYLMEQMGFHIAGGEYRYLRLGEKVTCRYDDDMKQQLLDCMNQFKEYMQKGYFPAAVPSEDEDPCKYCKYKGMCGNVMAPETDEEGGEV